MEQALPEQRGVGIEVPDSPQQAPDLLQEDLVDDEVMPGPHLQGDDAKMIPPDPQGGEQEPVERPVPDGLLADEIGDNFVMINGLRIERDSTLRTMRSACEALGLGKSGGKKLVFSRLLEHCRKGHARMALEIAVREREQGRRVPQGGPPLPVPPDVAVQERHKLTHLPFEAWCETCVATRSRDSERHEKRESPVPVISLDYMFTNTGAGHQPNSEMVKHLVGVDSWSKALLCLPIQGKGTVSLKKCTVAVTAFCRDYDNVVLKGDGEPALKQLIQSVMATRSSMAMKTSVEYIPQGHSQSNPAERAIQTVKRLGNTLLEEVRKGAGLQLPSSHVLFPWAYSHAAWLYNRFHVGANKQTAFEVATDRPYQGRLATFGSAVCGQPLPHRAQQRKGAPAWQKGVFVGKLADCDLAILCGVGGLFLSRGIRRCAQQWQGDLIMAVKGLPWEDRETPGPKPGMKALRRERQALEEEYGDDEDAKAVVWFARQKAAESLRSSPKEAADGSQDPLPPQGAPQPQQPEAVQVQLPQGEELHPELPQHPGQPQQPGVPQRPLPTSQAGMTTVEETAEASMSIEAADKRLVEEGEVQEGRATKLQRSGEGIPLRIPTSTSQSSSSAGLASSPTFAGNISKVNLGEDEEVEVDEELLQQPGDWGDLDDVDISELDKSEGDGPPDLLPEHLKQLEEEADLRLCGMGVLVPTTDEELTEEFRLMTTRHVYDWRFREGGWKRRSRLVARDYKFLQPELDGLFSPASNSLSTKMWAALVQCCGGKMNLYSADVKDAYLMVPQEEKVYVTLAKGEKYILGKCLPGQRVGSKSWYDLLAGVLQEKGLQVYKANPSVFYKCGTKENPPLIVSTHVVDLQVAGGDEDVQDLFQHLREQGWQLQVEGPCGPHVQGKCSFLKRKFVSDGEGKLWVKLNVKYITRLVDLLDLQGNKGKSVPTTGNFQKGLEYKEVSQQESRIFRTCVGILLYMASERPDIQCATRALASKVTGPDAGDWKELKQVVLYLKNTVNYTQEMKVTGSMTSVLTKMFNPGSEDEVKSNALQGPTLLQVFSDANWAGDRVTRKSSSCAQYFLNGNFFFSATRTQKSIALSSAESDCSSFCSS